MTFPQKGDRAVDYRATTRTSQIARVGPVVTVTGVTHTLVFTSDGGRYWRSDLKPFSQGRFSDRVLIPEFDDRVLIMRGREMLAALAATAANRAALDYSRPSEVAEALSEIGRDVATYHKGMADLMVKAIVQRQEREDQQ